MVAPARKAYTNDEKIDALVRMNTELLSEFWIMRDRMIVLEHLRCV